MFYTTKLEKDVIRRTKKCYRETDMEKNDSKVDVTFGCLLFYAITEENRRKFFDYIEYYNSASGTKIDFYILGISKCRKKDLNQCSIKDYEYLLNSPNGDGAIYKFNYKNFEKEVDTLEAKLGCKLLNTLTPKLILLDAEVDLDNKKIEYTDNWILDLKNDIRDGSYDELFREIFNCAEESYRTRMGTIRRNKKINILLGTNVRKIKDFTKNIFEGLITEGIVELIRHIGSALFIS